MEYFISVAALLLAYGNIYLCQCRSKSENDQSVALLVLAASVIPLLVGISKATLFLAAFSLIILGYFEFYYERRLWTIGRLANEVSEMPGQCGLLLLFAGEIAELLCRENFRFYSEHIGQLAFLAFVAHPDTLITRKERNEALCHALRFIHADIRAKWGNPPRSHSVSLLVERINRNVLFYLTTAKSGNMADIHNAARKNLSSLFGIYSRNFHLQEGKAADWSGAEAFAQLRRQFETELVKFPVRMELA